MKRNTVLLYAALAGLAVFLLFTLHVSSLDGLQGRLLAAVLPTDTEFAKGYSDEGFREVGSGIPAVQVLALLGEPLVKRTLGAGTEGWVYSRSPGSTNYLYREILFTGGVVLEKRHHFYVD